MLEGYSKVEKSNLDDFLDDELLTKEWQKEWKGMPEFNQHEVKPYATITIRFPDHAALTEFGKLVEQHITHRTKSMWFPKHARGLNSNKRYKG